MSQLPVLRRETRALWSLHHSIGFGMRKLRSRVDRVDDIVLKLTSAASKEIKGAIADRKAQLDIAKPPHA